MDDAALSLARTLTDGALSRYRTLAHGLPTTRQREGTVLLLKRMESAASEDIAEQDSSRLQVCSSMGIWMQAGLWVARAGLLRAGRDAGGLALVCCGLEAVVVAHLRRKKESDGAPGASAEKKWWTLLSRVELLRRPRPSGSTTQCSRRRGAASAWRLPGDASQRGGSRLVPPRRKELTHFP